MIIIFINFHKALALLNLVQIKLFIYWIYNRIIKQLNYVELYKLSFLFYLSHQLFQFLFQLEDIRNNHSNQMD